MGLDYDITLFIGRTCTDDEIKDAWAKIMILFDQEDQREIMTQVLMLDEFTGDADYIETDEDYISIKKKFTVDGSAQIIMKSKYDNSLNETSKSSEYEWYVVQKYITSQDPYSRYPKSIIDYTSFPKPIDKRYGIISLMSVG